MKIPFRIRDAVVITATIREMPFVRAIGVVGVGLVISASGIDALQAVTANTIGMMDSLTLGFIDPYRLKEIATA